MPRELAAVRGRRSAVLKVAAAAVICAAGAALAGTALGWFTATAHIPMTASTENWAPTLTCSPGTSKAVHWPGSAWHNTHVLPIASLDADGHLQLDFGDVVPGNGNNSPDVFRITSLSPDTTTLAFAAEGAVAPLISRIAFKGKKNVYTIGPGATKSVTINLDIPGDALSGEYRGFVLVSQLGGTTPICRIPTLITVKKPPPSQSSASEPSVSPEPQPSPATDSRPDTPSPEPTTVPDQSPSPKPSPATATAILEIAPGDAESQRLAGDPPAWTVFASADRAADGTLRIDLGDLVAGGSVQFADVLRVTCQSTTAVRLTPACDRGLLSLIESMGFDRSQTVDLGPGETALLSIATVVPADAAFGIRSGHIILTSSLDGQVWSIPVTVRIVADPSPAPTDSQTPAAD